MEELKNQIEFVFCVNHILQPGQKKKVGLKHKITQNGILLNKINIFLHG